jgi:hypothetical protein
MLDSVVTSTKTESNTVLGPNVISFISWGTNYIWYCGWGTSFKLYNRLRDLKWAYSFSLHRAAQNTPHGIHVVETRNAPHSPGPREQPMRDTERRGVLPPRNFFYIFY